MKNLNVDHIWRTLGPLGKYQVKQVLSYHLSLIAWSFQALNIVFIGHRPSFHCKPSPNDTFLANITDVKREYKECRIHTYENTTDGIVETSTSCIHGWEYAAPVDQSFVTEWNFVCENEELAELTQVLYLVGMMIGTFVFPILSDRFGRKPVMVISNVCVFGVSIGISFSGNYTVFFILRLFTGFFQQGLLAGTTLSLETLPTEIRHYWEISALLAWTTFVCLLSPIAYLLRNYQWKYLQMAYALCGAWALFQWWFTDESLRWVLANGQIQRAKEIIKTACKWNNKNYQVVLKEIGWELIDETSTEVMNYNRSKNNESEKNDRPMLDPLVLNTSKSNRSNSAGSRSKRDQDDFIVKQYSILDIFKHTPILKVSAILWYTWICDSLVYYGIYMISSDLYGDRYINFFLSSLVEYPACLIEYFCLARIGRKWTAIMGHFIAALGLAIATALTYTADGNTSMLAAATAFTLIGKLGVSLAYSVMYLTTPELYPTNMRNAAGDAKVIIDGGWQKRGSGHSYNSLSGHITVVGSSTKKSVDFGVAKKTCRKCSVDRRKRKTSIHRCRKNYSGSAKGMESFLAVNSIRKLVNKGLNVKTIVMDDDTTTISKVKNTMSSDIEKFSDSNHVSKNFFRELYLLQTKHKTLSQKVISYLKKCFNYAVAQSKSNPTLLSRNLSAIIPHAYGDHTHCIDVNWCGYREDRENYHHKSLPHGNDLTDPNLKRDLEHTINKYITDDMTRKLALMETSNPCENLNSMICRKAPKTLHLSSTESLDFRVAAAVLQKNEGTSSTCQVYHRHNMSPSKITESISSKKDRVRYNRAAVQATVAFKKQRIELKNMRTQEGALREALEGTTYQSRISEVPTPEDERTVEIPVPIQLPDQPKEGTNSNIVVFDLETTGLAHNSSIIQMSALDMATKEEFSMYVFP